MIRGRNLLFNRGKYSLALGRKNVRGLSKTTKDGQEADDTDELMKNILENIKKQMSKRSVQDKPGEEKLMVAYTCSYDGPCDQTSQEARRTNKIISKKSYETGVVLVKCPCDKLHLIADNLGWFDDKKVNIETILAEKGEQVQRLGAQDLVDIES